jgi:hypothetical protein
MARVTISGRASASGRPKLHEKSINKPLAAEPRKAVVPNRTSGIDPTLG